MNESVPHIRGLLDGTPSNWGRWGDADEIGSLNHLTPERVLDGVKCVRNGLTFTLGLPIGSGRDPMWPGGARAQTVRVNTHDHSDYRDRGAEENPGGLRYADDRMELFLQAVTHYDALGHVWYDDMLWNGHPAASTEEALSLASAQPIAEHGIVGRGVLVDMARYAGKDALAKTDSFDLAELLAAAAAQGVEVGAGANLIVRTGHIGSFYERSDAEFFEEYQEPGLVYSREAVEWFRDSEIASFSTDTMANEQTVHGSGVTLPFHGALLRNLGITFGEMLALDTLAEACASAGHWDFLFVASPLKIVGASGAPVNPVAIT